MKKRAPRNRTLILTEKEGENLARNLINLTENISVDLIRNKIINQEYFKCAPYLPSKFVDLLIVDPPYNLTKDYHGNVFKSKNIDGYTAWFDSFVKSILHTLKPNATVYVCSDWKTSNLVFPVLSKYFTVRNRITWQRDKGRGAKTNWKNNTEDIWFCTVSNEYCFNVDSVKMKRKVLAPYRENGKPKDWEETDKGNFRLTYPSNIWSDITIPFWSMPENTDHPTQKPEKLIAKLILASSNKGDFVFDPFMGSGTTAIVSKKLSRNYAGIEMNREYCCWAGKRLQLADIDPSIQGYSEGVFWERNSLSEQVTSKSKSSSLNQGELF